MRLEIKQKQKPLLESLLQKGLQLCSPRAWAPSCWDGALSASGASLFPADTTGGTRRPLDRRLFPQQTSGISY